MTDIYCLYFKTHKPAMAAPPYPGKIGKTIHANISSEAWGLWLEKQTNLMNEHRMNPLDPENRRQLEIWMMAFLNITDLVEDA